MVILSKLKAILIKCPKVKNLMRAVSRIHLRRRMRKTLDKGEKLQVAFILNDSAIWKFHTVYEAMRDSKTFEPKIWIWNPPHGSRSNIEDSMAFCLKRGYTFIRLADMEEPAILREYRTLHFLFFGLPYSWAWPQIPFSYNSKNRPLHCYVPYSFNVSDLTFDDYNKWFFMILDFHFHPTSLHKSISLGQGAFPWISDVVSGYPGIEEYAHTKRALSLGKPTLIYAPHHTISNENSFGLSYSTFEDFGEFIRDLMLQTKDLINWVFKPHSLLFSKLLSNSSWGEGKTNNYYEDWRKNAQVQEGNYGELFQVADGMIHDSGSFLAEFLATGKPVMYLKKKAHSQPRLNEFGLLCLEHHYIGESEDAINSFVQETILLGVDPEKNRRMQFITSYSYRHSEISASQIITDVLEQETLPQL
jgi:hypothetical protein